MYDGLRHIFGGMPIIIEQKGKKETVINITGKVGADDVDRATKYLRYLELTADLKSGTREDVEALARSVKRGMASKRRKRLAS